MSDQLRLFAERLKKWPVSFKVFNTDASLLAKTIGDNDLLAFGIPASIQFDRIEVSNILDINYAGIDNVLTNWAPFLSKSVHAAIMGYFMNWSQFEPQAG